MITNLSLFGYFSIDVASSLIIGFIATAIFNVAGLLGLISEDKIRCGIFPPSSFSFNSNAHSTGLNPAPSFSDFALHALVPSFDLKEGVPVMEIAVVLAVLPVCSIDTTQSLIPIFFKSPNLSFTAFSTL